MRFHCLTGTPALSCILQNIKPHLKEQLQKLLNDSGVPDRILLNPLGEEYADDTELVKLYQACDIGMNTSLGEGWG